MCYFSKLEHMAHHKAKNRNIQNKLARARVDRTSWRGEISEVILKDGSVFDDLTLQRRPFQTDSAEYILFLNLWSSTCVRTGKYREWN